jgi:hypothetical protein
VNDPYGNFTAPVLQEAIVITGAENIRKASYLALRSALKLEVKGFKRRGRSARVIANEAMGTRISTSRKTYEAFNTWLVNNYEAVDRPLEEKA